MKGIMKIKRVLNGQEIETETLTRSSSDYFGRNRYSVLASLEP
jgi:hypothetical protein